MIYTNKFEVGQVVVIQEEGYGGFQDVEDTVKEVIFYETKQDSFYVYRFERFGYDLLCGESGLKAKENT